MNIAAKNLTPTVTTGPLPASRKIHVAGELHPEPVDPEVIDRGADQ
jgi:phosphomethylpyrimidine synthase